jgi:hypothetical protein
MAGDAAHVVQITGRNCNVASNGQTMLDRGKTLSPAQPRK